MTEERSLETAGQNLESMGHFLRTERERRGMTRRDIAVHTRIPLDQIDVIEEGRLSGLPPVFAKGFLRAYANELNLDAEKLLDEYRALTGGSKNQPAGSLTPKYVESSVARAQTPVGKIMLALVLLAAILGAVYYFVPQVNEAINNFLKKGEAAAPAATTEPAPTPAPAAEAAPAPVAAPAPAPAEAAVAPTAPPPAAAPVQAGGQLTLTCLKNTWVSVTVDGKRPEHITFRGGQSRSWKARQDIVVKTGNASAISVKWNDEDLGPMGENQVMEMRFPKVDGTAAN